MGRIKFKIELKKLRNEVPGSPNTPFIDTLKHQVDSILDSDQGSNELIEESKAAKKTKQLHNCVQALPRTDQSKWTEMALPEQKPLAENI